MNEPSHQPVVTDAPSELPAAAPVEVSSAARRRQVLRGLSSGAALAAAGAPLSALATGGRKWCFHKDTPHRHVKASVSGMQSTITSNMAVGGWTESKGKHCSYYHAGANWPSDSGGRFCRGNNNAKFLFHNAKFKDMFGCFGGGNNELLIKDLLNKRTAPHCHWITACLNATKLTTDFSYSASEVVNLFNNPAKNLFALQFFRDYQENHRS